MSDRRPAPDEFAPYYERYIARVPDGGVVDALRAQGDSFRALLDSAADNRARYAYAPGKWTLAEVIQHVIDGERVFTYRALRIARGDTTPLPGFEQDDWIVPSEANTRALRSLRDEFATVRAATITLFTGLPAAAWARRGTASNNPVSVRALAFIAAGHAIHHETIIRERYLGAAAR